MVRYSFNVLTAIANFFHLVVSRLLVSSITVPQRDIDYCEYNVDVFFLEDLGSPFFRTGH